MKSIAAINARHMHVQKSCIILLFISSDGSFVPGDSYDGATLQIQLPPEWSMCDFAWFSIWCEDFNQTFSAIEFQPAYFVSC